MPIESEIKAPLYLDKKKLYKLADGEVVLFSIEPNQTLEEISKHYTSKEIDNDPEVIRLLAEAQEMARRIESGPDIAVSGSMDIEMQGHYKEIRVVPKKDSTKGYRVKGWTLIGVRKNP